MLREEKIAFAEKFSISLSVGDFILLSGDLGAGKTTFVKGLAKGLNIGDEVTSPTYASSPHDNL